VKKHTKPELGRSTGDASFGDDWFITPAMPSPQDIPSESIDMVADEQTELTAANESTDITDRATNLSHVGDPSTSGGSESTVDPITTHESGGLPQTEVPHLSVQQVEPVQEKKPPTSEPPPKRLYRDIPGRPRKPGLSSTSVNSGLKLSGTLSREMSAAPLAPSSAAPEAGSSDTAGKHQFKKAEKRAARQAKKAAKAAHQGASEETGVVSNEISSTEGPHDQLVTTSHAKADTPQPNAMEGPSNLKSDQSDVPHSAVVSAGPSESVNEPAAASATPQSVSTTENPENFTSITSSSLSQVSVSTNQNPELGLEPGCCSEDVGILLLHCPFLLELIWFSIRTGYYSI
jgi:hypothetical protein